MMRFVFSLVGGVLLALALVFAVADISRSLADDALRLTSIGEGLTSVGLAVGPGDNLSANAVDLFAVLQTWPASITFGLVAFLFLFAGRPPHRRRRFVR